MDVRKEAVADRVPDLKSAADDVLSRNGYSFNPLQLLHVLPKKFGCHKTRETAKHYVSKFYKDVFYLEEFLKLRPEDLIEVINRNDIDIENEDVLVNSVLDWFQYKWEDRNVYLADVMEHVRLPLCTDEYLYYVVKDHPYLAKEPGRKYVLEAVEYASSCKVYQHQICTPRTMPRTHFDARRKLVILDRGKFMFNIAPNVANEWLGPTDIQIVTNHKLSRAFAACVIPSGILITGGLCEHVACAECFLFNIQQNIWKEFPSLIEGRAGHTVIYYNGDIFAFGGKRKHPLSTKNSGEVYKAGHSAWEPCLPLPEPLSGRLYIKMVTNGEYIYAVHGSQFWAFHPSRRTWERKAPMPNAGYAGCNVPVSYNDSIFHLGSQYGGSFNRAAKYDTLTDTWTELHLPQISLHNTMAVDWKGQILVYGQSAGDNQHFFNLYDPYTDSWTMDKKSLVPAYGLFQHIFNVKIEQNQPL